MAPEGRRRVGRGALPKNVKSMSKEVLEATLKKKKECDARALEVVERLLEADVAEEAFLACLPLIQESHFRDVVEERAISALCGYPLCSAPLDLRTAPERKYTINTRLNKVYDITERKNFCSNLCYKSARFVKDQLLTSPLWLRDGEEVPTFTLLPSFASGGPAGEEVDIGKVPSLKDEVEKLKRDGSGKSSSLGKKASSQRPMAEEEGERKVVEPAVESGRREADRLSPGNSALAKSENVSVVPDLRPGSATTENIPNKADGSSAVTTSKEVMHEAIAPVALRPESATSDRINGEVGEKSALAASGEVANDKATVERIENEMKEVCQVSQLVQTWEGEVHVHSDKVSVCQSDILVMAEATVRPSAKLIPKEGESKVPTKSSVARVESCLEEWVTMETLVLLLGEDTVREAVTTTGTDLKELLLKPDDGAWDASTRETYRNICRRLNLMELEDARYDTAVAREGRELRPLPDYAAVREESLRMQLKVRAFLGGRTGYEVPPPVEGEGGGEEGTCYLPLVDRHAKGAIRRRMVLDRLSRVIPSLTQLLRLSCRDVTSDLRTVVSTFALEAHNITFKPPEWNLLGLVLLKMISLKNSEIGSALESETARGHAAGILAVFRQREGYLDGLVAQLMDVQKVLGKRARHSGGGDS